MVLQLVKKIESGIRALSIAYALDILFVWAALTLAVYGFCGNLPVILVAVTALTLAASIIAGKILRRANRDNRSVCGRIETAVFGARTLVIDSVVEFASGGSHSDAVAGEELKLRSNQKYITFETSEIRTLAARTAAGFVVMLVLSAAIALTVPAASRKTAGLRAFLNYVPVEEIPVYYIQGKPLTLDLSRTAASFDETALIAGGRMIVSSNGLFTLGEDMTAGDSIHITVAVKRFGILRRAASYEIYGTTKLLPNHMTMKVVYPFGEETYSSLQDVEIWRGGRIEITGDLTKDLSNVTLAPDSASVSIDRNRFFLSFSPRTAGTRTLEFASSDGDRFTAPAFTVRTLENQPPTIRLIYPQGTIMLSYFEWTIQSIVECEDDQGVSRVWCRVVVTNRDPALTYKTERTFSISGGNERYFKTTVKFDWSSLELLPNDAATIVFYCEDAFGKRSREVSFHIISPDLLEMQMERERTMQEALQSIGNATNRLNELRQELSENNTAGANRTASEIQSELSNLQSSIQSIQNSFSEDAQSIQDVRRTMEKIREITEFVRQNTESLANIAEAMRNQNLDVQQLEMQAMNVSQMLEELSSLLDSLEYYKQVSDLLNQMNILQNTYESMKPVTNEQAFERHMESYQNELERMQDVGNEEIDATVQKLIEEVSNLSMGNSGSFQNSDELMAQLSSQVQQQAGMAGQNRTMEQMKRLNSVVEELFLQEVVLVEAKQLPVGDSVSPVITNIAKVVELVNSVDYSFKAINREIEDVIEGMVFEGNVKKELRSLLEKNRAALDASLAGLRDNNSSQLAIGLNRSANYVSAIAAYLMKINQALKDMMSQQGQSGGAQQMMSMGMGDLMMMQSMMSRGIQQLYQQMQQQGGMTEEMRQMMSELSRLQSEIQQNFQQLMQQSGGGLVEGGGDMNRIMEEIVKNLESYNVDQNTLEMSEDLEERLLDSMKALQSRGVSEERQAQTAGIYQSAAPDANSDSAFRRIDLSQMGNEGMSEYYKTLIERYLQSRGTAER